MGSHNSHVVYTTLYVHLLEDIATSYVDSDVARDLMKIKQRINSEGISFLTKSLPRLGKWLDATLAGGNEGSPVGFELTELHLPKLFGWLWPLIFEVRVDADDCALQELQKLLGCRSQPCVTYVPLTGDEAIRAVRHARQLLYFVYKLELPYDTKDTKSVLTSFVAVENELSKLTIDGSDAIIKKARAFISAVLSGLDPRDIIPRHGPGAVATGEKNWEKSHFSRIYRGLEAEFPFTGYFCLPGQLADVADTLCNPSYRGRFAVEELDEGCAKVVLVPKDSRGPRLISCEPLEYQWIQQGLASKIVSRVESHPLTAGHVNFTCQEVNRRLALSSSRDGEWVTLDMKEASDRVSLVLVQELFQGTTWLPALLAARTSATRLPDGTVIVQKKFAPMGSALCFPVEALVFWALSVACLQVRKGLSRRVACRSVYVYGDDIICNSKDYAVVMQTLPLYGLMFNESKCCTSGFFRESCGCDAYRGVDVTPVRLRKVWCPSKDNATNLISWVELSNSLYERGYRRSSSYIKQIVERQYGVLPFVTYKRKRGEDSQSYYSSPGQVIGWYCSDVNPIAMNLHRGVKMRYNAHLHRDEVRGYALRVPHRRDTGSGWEACLRSLVKLERANPSDCGRRLPSGTYADAHRSRLVRTWGIGNTDGYLNLI